ncbi:MAG: hypothetical protein WKG01_31770 [Kofleriaceae bacterium]
MNFVLESHVGSRPGDADRTIGPVLRQFAARGYRATPSAVIKQLGPHVPWPGIQDPDLTIENLRQQIEGGYNAWSTGEFKTAVRALTDTFALLRRNPALIVVDTTYQDTVFKGLVALGLSQSRLGKAQDSERTLRELIRTFPSHPFPKSTYGSEAETFYRAVRKTYEAESRGTLRVNVSDPKAVVFVNGQIRGMGKTATADLFPGLYRVFVQVPSTMGRLYEVEVKPNDETELAVDWEVDSALFVSSTWVGFQFAGHGARGAEGRLAARLAQTRGNAKTVVVLGVAQLQGKATITGTLYRTDDGAMIRSGTVTVEGDGPASVEPLAAFLVDGEQRAGVLVTRDEAPPSVRAEAPAPRRGLAKLVVGAGALVLVTGGVLFALDQDDDGSRFKYRDTAPLGVALGAVGAAAVGVGLYLWSRGGTRESRPLVAIGRGDLVLGWHGQF